MQKKIVLTGGPSTGKSTVLEELINRNYNCMTEISREVTLNARKNGVEQLFLTKPLLFSELLIEGRINQYIEAEKQKAVTVVENQIQQATFSLENPLPTLNLTFKKQAGKYHIIAGAFRIATNADKKIKELTDIGFSPILVGVNKYGLHQVFFLKSTGKVKM